LEIKISKIGKIWKKIKKNFPKKVKNEIDANLENPELKNFLALQNFDLSTLSRFHEFLPTKESELKYYEIKDKKTQREIAAVI